MRFSLTGGQVGWMMNTSRPRTSSSILQEISPSGKFAITARPNGSPRYSQMRLAKAGWARPVKSFMEFMTGFVGKGIVA